MNSSRRNRRQAVIASEFLETRNLLSAAHVTVHAAAHVAKAAVHHAHATAAPTPKPPPAPKEISGTLTGVSPYVSNPLNPNQGYDTYTATAPTKSGLAYYYGTDAYTSVQVSPTTEIDTYFNGFTVLYLGGNNDISINYVGTGTYPTASTGAYSATFTGKAVGITGTVLGHQYTFNAVETGNADTDAVTIKFTLKS